MIAFDDELDKLERQALTIAEAFSKASVVELLKEVGKELAIEYRERLVKNIISKNVLTGLGISMEEYTKYIVVEGATVLLRHGGDKTSTDLPIEEVYFILEFGRRDKGIAAQNFWGKTLDEFQERMREKFAEAFKEFIIKKVTGD